jgi:hypothetical protein
MEGELRVLVDFLGERLGREEAEVKREEEEAEREEGDVEGVRGGREGGT